MADESKQRTDLRERILDGAVELLRADALYQMNVEQIAEAIGVSRKSVYNHFTGKANLIAEAVTASFERVVADLSVVATDRSTGYVERLDRIVEVGFQEIHRVLRPALAFRSQAIPLEVSRRVKELNHRLYELIESVVTEGAERGLIGKAIEPKVLSRVLLNIINGIRLLDETDALGVSPTAVLQESLRVCLVGALSRRGRTVLAASHLLSTQRETI